MTAATSPSTITAFVAGYGPLQALEVSLRPITVFVGRNDSGKSSILRALHSILAPGQRSRVGWWLADELSAASLRQRLSGGSGMTRQDHDETQLDVATTELMEGTLGIQGAEVDQPARVVVRAPGGEDFTWLSAIDGHLWPFEEVVDLDTTLDEAISAVAAAGKQGIHFERIATTAWDLLPQFARHHYDGIDPALPGMVLKAGQGAVVGYSDLAAGVQSWLLIALKEACRRLMVGGPSGSRPTLYLLDEPEVHLHPLASVETVIWVQRRAQEGAWIAVASHSGAFLDFTAAPKMISLVLCLRVPGGATSVVEWTTDDLTRLHDTAAAAGFRVSDVYLAGAPLFVEGKHDKQVVEMAWRARFGRLPEADGVHVIALNGIDNLPDAIDQAELLFPSKVATVLIDDPDLDYPNPTRMKAISSAERAGMWVVSNNHFDIAACLTRECLARAGTGFAAESWAAVEKRRRAMVERRKKGGKGGELTKAWQVLGGKDRLACAIAHLQLQGSRERDFDPVFLQQLESIRDSRFETLVPVE